MIFEEFAASQRSYYLEVGKDRQIPLFKMVDRVIFYKDRGEFAVLLPIVLFSQGERRVRGFDKLLKAKKHSVRVKVFDLFKSGEIELFKSRSVTLIEDDFVELQLYGLS